MPAQLRKMLRAIAEVRSNPSLKNAEILRYKLDPDERGVLRSATPGESHAAVTNQEQTNIRRLSAEAEARGEDVVSVSVHYKGGLVNGKLALRAGQTEVVSIKREQSDATDAVYRANREAAFSLGLLDLSDEAGLRSIYGGLTPADEAETC